MFQIRHLRQILCLLLLTHNLPLTHIGFKPLIKVVQTHRTIRNRQDNQNDRQHREDRQGGASCVVLCAVTWLVDADELEEEVGQRGNVKADGGDHAGFDFFACPESGEGEDNDCDWNGGYGEIEFPVCDVCDDDEKLDGEAEEEVEIELEKCDINLRGVSKVQAFCKRGILPEMRGICASF